jgi:hypothetical protein
MPTNSDPKTLKLKKVDIICKVKGHKRAVCWKAEKKHYLLTNMHNPHHQVILWKKKKIKYQNLHAMKVTTTVWVLMI